MLFSFSFPFPPPLLPRVILCTCAHITSAFFTSRSGGNVQLHDPHLKLKVLPRNDLIETTTQKRREINYFNDWQYSKIRATEDGQPVIPAGPSWSLPSAAVLLSRPRLSLHVLALSCCSSLCIALLVKGWSNYNKKKGLHGCLYPVWVYSGSFSVFCFSFLSVFWFSFFMYYVRPSWLLREPL